MKNKIITITILIILFLILIFYRNNYDIPVSIINKESTSTQLVFLKLKTKYVGVDIPASSNSITNRFSYMTCKVNYNDTDIYSEIPLSTSLLSYEVSNDRDTLTLNLSKEFLRQPLTNQIVLTYNEFSNININVESSSFLTNVKLKSVNVDFITNNTKNTKMVTVFKKEKYIIPITYVIDNNQDTLNFIRTIYNDEIYFTNNDTEVKLYNTEIKNCVELTLNFLEKDIKMM